MKLFGLGKLTLLCAIVWCFSAIADEPRLISDKIVACKSRFQELELLFKDDSHNQISSTRSSETELVGVTIVSPMRIHLHRAIWDTLCEYKKVDLETNSEDIIQRMIESGISTRDNPDLFLNSLSFGRENPSWYAEWLNNRYSADDIKKWRNYVKPALQANLGSVAISSKFLKTIITSNTFDVPGFDFINIVGVSVDGVLDLSNNILRSSLILQRCIFLNDVILDQFRTDHNLNLIDSEFRKPISAQAMNVRGSVYFGRAISDYAAPVEGYVKIASLDMSRSIIGGEIKIHNVYLEHNAIFYGVRVNHVFSLLDSIVYGADLYGSSVGHLELAGVNFKYNRAKSDPEKEPVLDASAMNIEQDVYLNRSKASGEIKFSGAHIKGTIEFQGLTIFGSRPHLDLSNTIVEGELKLGRSETTEKNMNWDAKSFVRLDNAKVGSIQAPFSDWPGKLMLNGIELKAFKKYDYQSNPVVVNLEDVLSWLDRGVYRDYNLAPANFDPSSFATVAEIFRVHGHEDYANQIAFRSKVIETEQAFSSGDFGSWAWLSMMYYLIGYGYYPWFSVFWVAGLTIIGAIIFSSTHECKNSDMSGLGYSFDMLLPVIKLREKHYGTDIEERAQRYYFYFHKIMGWVIGGFLAASLSGLTKL